MEIKELGHIVLYVRDLERSQRFYGEILGWKQIPTPHGKTGRAAFSSGRTHHELYLIEVGSDAAALPPGRRVGMYHFGLKVGESDEELRQVLEHLTRHGVTIAGGTDHGVTHSLYIHDPDGHEIELYIDVQPERWRDDPSVFYAPAQALRL
jgi:catechol 2,3-dioxygenase